jgi:polyhydroxybutyrate depolymerase
MTRTFLAVCAAGVLLLAACGGGSSSHSTPVASMSTTALAAAGCAPALGHAPGTTNETVQSGGLARRYILHVPPGYDGGKRLPLVLGLHGYGQPNDLFAQYTDFATVADAAGFVMAIPAGTGDPLTWNDAKLVNRPDDEAFLKDALAALQSTLCLDPDRVYLAGFSLGGAMAIRTACDAPETFAAVGLVSAVYVGCQPKAPLIAFHGIADPVVPFEGGDNPPERGGGTFPPVRRAVSGWAVGLGCDGLPLISRPAPSVELSAFQRCGPGTDVSLYAISGGGHSWPGSKMTLPENLVGTTSQAIDATKTMWEFFAAHPRAH